MEDPNLQLSFFLEVGDTLKINGASTDVIHLRLFPFSLKDMERAWFHSLPSGSITTGDELNMVFLGKFFPPCKTMSLRNQITSLTQRKDESLYETWECFKDQLTLCTNHGLQRWMIVQTFYNGTTQAMRSMIDAMAGGTLMSKTEDEAYNMIEQMVPKHYQWSNECGQPKRVGGNFNVDALILLAAKMDAMT